MKSPGNKNKTPACLLVCDSIHFVLAAEKVFKKREVWCELVPVPRSITSDCGMAVSFRSEDLPAVREIVSDPSLCWRALYAPADKGYDKIEECPTD